MFDIFAWFRRPVKSPRQTAWPADTPRKGGGGAARANPEVASREGAPLKQKKPRSPAPALSVADESAAAGGYLAIHNVEKSFGTRKVVKGVSLYLRRGEAVGLLGPNGAGKSTLVKALAGELAPVAGTRTAGHGLEIGYFAQHQLELLRPDESPLEHMARDDRQARELELRTWLGAFDFRGDMADAPVGRFSGGEQSRLALALLVRRRPNLLLLDEPTNHLDLEMRHALTRALAEYAGSLLVVSHDRALLRTVCDSFLVVADGRVTEFAGDVDDYLAWLGTRRAQAVAVPADRAARRADRAAAEAERQSKLSRRRPLQREARQLEERVGNLEAERRAVEERLADPALYASGDAAAIQAATRRAGELARELEAAESRWLEVQAELEAIGEA